MNFEIGKTYIAHKRSLLENEKWSINVSTFIRHPDDYLHPIYRFFDNEPFLIIEELYEFNNDESKKYKALVSGDIWFFIYYGEPQTKFELVC